MKRPQACPPVPLIRRARREDLDAVDMVESRSFDLDRFPRNSLKRLLAARTAECFVAELDGEIAGYVAVLFRAGATVARIYSIAVDPASRGKGSARGLIAAAEKAARKRGSRAVRLEVRASNKAALSLYERAGFTFLERKPGYYQNGEDALRLEKHLEPRKAGGRSAL